MKARFMVIVGLALAAPAAAQPLVQGWVRLASGEPVAAVQVLVFDLTDLQHGPVAQTTTDGSGWFALPSLGKALPQSFSLGANYPNPFNPSTIIPYQLPAAAPVRLEVFNLLGQRIATLVDRQQPAGFHTAAWNANNAAGKAVAAGVYLYRLQAGDQQQTKRMVLIDGQAGVAVAGAWTPASTPAAEAAPRYGLVVTGAGVEAWADADFGVRPSMAPLDIVVEAAEQAPRGKVLAGGILGDVNGDGRVDFFDALLVALYSVDPSLVLPNDGSISLGDVNADGRVDLTDAHLIAAYLNDPSDPSLPPGIGQPVGAAAVSKIYWTDSRARKIQRANLDGSGIRNLVTGVYASGIALDLAGGEVYWTEWGTSSIRRANLDGSRIQVIVTGLDQPVAVALDVIGSKIYWTDRGTDDSGTSRIQRANLDGSGIQDLITGLSGTEGIALDVAGGRMHWTDHRAGKIRRANLDGSRIQDLVTGLTAPGGIALDVAGGKIYWTDYGGKIQRANLDGSRIQDLVTGLDLPAAIALDLAGGKIYWTDWEARKIQRANLDGSRVEDLVTTGLDSPWGIALGGNGDGVGSSNPDLVVESPSVSDRTLTTGQTFTLRATVRNRGDARSPATTLRYYRSSNATITASDTRVGTDAVPALSASGGSQESISLSAPSSAGTYYYGACVQSVSGESDTGNNCSTGVRVTVTRANPDLVVESPWVSDNTLTTGQSFTLRATVRNRGDARSAATTLRSYRSSNATITTTDTRVGTDPVRALAAGASSTESIPLSAPSSAGTYYYGACVQSVSGESDTNNNCSPGVRVSVTSAHPDLVVQSPWVSDNTLTTGQSFTLRATVRNRGSGASAATTLRYYRSPNATITASDMRVGTDPVSALSASGTSTESIPLTAPSNAGTYYYGACVLSVSGESDTNNNCSPGVRVTVRSAGGDDHGDTRSAASSLSPGSSRSGRIDPGGDVDYFRVQISGSGELTVGTSGSTDTRGQLLDSAGARLASDDNGGGGANFLIEHGVTAGTYFIQVRGGNSSTTGPYTLHSRFFGGSGDDDHGNIRPAATTVALGSATPGELSAADLDYFRVTMDSPGVLLAYTTGTTDTYGTLYDGTGNELTDNHDGGEGANFRLVALVSPGTYYIRVRGTDTSEAGRYTLRVQERVQSGVSYDSPAFVREYDNRVVVIGLPGLLETDEIDFDAAAEIFFEHYEDAFDYLMFFSNLEDISQNQLYSYFGIHMSVRNTVKGTGRRIHSRTREVGSAGKLNAILHFPYNAALLDGPSLHEIMHSWANYAIPTVVRAHWGFSSANGQLGGFDPANLVDLGGARYAAGDFGTFANYGNSLPYSPIELYFAGLIPPSEVPDLWVAEDGAWLWENDEWVRDDSGHLIFTASQVSTWSVDRIVSEYGTRVPDSRNSQKGFRAAAILLVDQGHPAQQTTLDAMSAAVRKFSHVGSDDDRLYNFWEATGGRATLAMGGLSTYRNTAVGKPTISYRIVESANDQDGHISCAHIGAAPNVGRWMVAPSDAEMR